MIANELAHDLHSITRDAQIDVNRLGGGARITELSHIELFDRLVTDSDVASASRGLFVDGYYALSVEEACKCIANKVKDLSGKHDKDGQDLMFFVFNEENPVIRLNSMITTSEKDEQRGYKFLFGGLMSGIRNPRVHEYKFIDDAEVALDLIQFVDHLMARLRRGTKV